MTPHPDSLAELLRRHDQPVAPSPAFADALRTRLRAELAAAPDPKEETMRATPAGSTPHAASLLAPPSPAPLLRPSPRWGAVWHLLAAAGLLVTLAGGIWLGRILGPASPGPVGLPASFQTPADDVAAPGVPMRGADPGRTSLQLGPAPATMPGLAWSAFAAVGALPPIVVDDAVYVATDGGDVVAFDRRSGAEQWRVPLGGGMDTPTFAAGLLYVSVVIDSELASSAGTIVALDAATGVEQWRATTGSFGGTSPVVVDGVVFAGGDQIVHAFDAATGESRWSAGLAAAACACKPRALAVADGLVFAVPGGLLQASVFAFDAATGEQVWRFDGEAAHFFTDPVATNGFVYVGEGSLVDGMTADPAGGAFFALDAATGDVAWRLGAVPDASDRALAGTLLAPPAVTSEAVYFHAQNAGDEAGTLRALDARSGDDLWTVPIADASLAAPVVVDDLVVFPAGTRDGYAAGHDDVALFAYDAGTGAAQWQLNLAGSISGPPAVLDGTVYATTYGEGALFALSETGAPLATPTATGASGTADVSGRPPCTAAARVNPYAHELPAEAAPAVLAAGQAKAGKTAADLPRGDPLDPAATAILTEVLHQFAACIGGDPTYLYGFFSEGFFVRAESAMAAAQAPLDGEFAVTRGLPPFSPFADLTVRDARRLPDGRLLGIFDGGFNPIAVVFLDVDGIWVIDEIGALAPDGGSPAIGSPEA